MRILFLGPKDNATSLQRVNALIENGNIVNVIHDRIIGKKYSLLFRTIRFLFRISGYRIEENSENKKLYEKAKTFNPELVFITKGLTIKKKTLQKIRKVCSDVKIICYSLDDVMNKGNSSKIYLKSIPEYDIHFTSKKYNIEEILSLGAIRVELIKNSYSPIVHRPIEVTQKDKLKYGSRVCFIGGYEKERAASLLFLAKNNIRVRIWGNNWNKYKIKHENLLIENKPVYGEAYAKAICSSKILLGFLRKANRDQITTRTVEIPACKSFLLAERTKEQTDLFKEGYEAEYFGDNNELLTKIKYYLNNDNKRIEIENNGYNKCFNLKISYNDSMRDLTGLIEKC
jgi:spore maturation protein CgeB